MAKSRLKHTHDRLPDWLDSPKMRAAFMGGITESAMYQGGQTTRTATRESAEAENKRRWELLRKERKTARDQNLEAEATREQFAKEKFTWQQGASGRQLANQQAIETWRAEQGLEKQKIEWEREAEAMEELDAYERAERKKGTPEDRIKIAVGIKRKRMGLPAAKAAAATNLQRFEIDGRQYTFNPSTGEAIPIEGVPAEQQDADGVDPVDVKRYVDMAGKTIEKTITDMGLVDKEGFAIDPKSHLEQIQFMENLWPIIESYHKMDPTLAEYTVELAKSNLSKQNREYLDRLYQQEIAQPSQQTQQAPAAATAQGQPQPAQAQPQVSGAAQTDPTVLALAKAMGSTLTPEQEAIVAQAQSQNALDKIKARAKAGDTQAQDLLKANGIPWQ